MNYLIIFAHPEEDSSLGKLLAKTEEALTNQGNTVRVSKLYQDRFSPILRPGDFPELDESKPLKIQTEQ